MSVVTHSRGSCWVRRLVKDHTVEVTLELGLKPGLCFGEEETASRCRHVCTGGGIEVSVDAVEGCFVL